MGDLIGELDGQLLDGLEFCAKAYALFEELRTEPGGIERLRLRTGEDEKRLLDEILPICRYVQTYYRPGRYISVRWVNGRQSYDAELIQSGDYVTHGYYGTKERQCLRPKESMQKEEHLLRRNQWFSPTASMCLDSLLLSFLLSEKKWALRIQKIRRSSFSAI